MTVAGASYSDVPSVVLPKTGGGSATFTDVTDTTAGASDVASGKYFYTAGGVRTMGTGENEVAEVTISTAGAVTQALDAGKIYHFTGALTSLTITFNATTGLAQYHFDLNCGSTAPTVTLPSGVVMPDSFAFAASKHYEVDILNNYGVAQAWATS